MSQILCKLKSLVTLSYRVKIICLIISLSFK